MASIAVRCSMRAALSKNTQASKRVATKEPLPYSTHAVPEPLRLSGALRSWRRKLDEGPGGGVQLGTNAPMADAEGSVWSCLGPSEMSAEGRVEVKTPVERRSDPVGA